MKVRINFAGQTVLVTGASRGIGKSISLHFESLGADVIKLSSANYDLSRDEDIGRLCSYIKELPKVDILINNAGINRINDIEDIVLNDYEDIMQINVKAPFLISQSAIPKMKSNKYGRIINITSIFGHCTKEQRLCYTTSKYALTGMTKAMSTELASYNILVNSVAPGFTATDMTEEILGPEGIAEMSSRVPIKRLARPGEIAKVVMFLASDQNTYLTGQNIIVDGGFVNV